MTDKPQVQRKVYDITIPIVHDEQTGKISPSHEEMAIFAATYTKHYVYARQKGDVTEKEHWQCRFTLKRPSLPTKVIKDLKKLFGRDDLHIEPTEGKDQRDHRTPGYYAYIQDTTTLYPGERVWSDKDQGVAEKYKENITWYPWQQKVIDMKTNDRQVIVIHDPKGGTGKSTLAKRLNYLSKATYLPLQSDAKNMLRAISNLRTDGKLRDTIFIDIPRAVEGKNLKELIIGIEAIKNSILSEDRYHFSQEEIPDVKVVIMCNNLPNPNWLTADRWRAYAIVNNDLQPINIQEVYNQQQDEYKMEQLQHRRAYYGYQGKHKNKKTDLEP
ncbi:hypothetical protein [Methanolacinia petrolearia]|uniref:hypothetical protein n=1 Tax=Methanolacinia petrolearia TaxID=54120 RepID=UPI003BA8AE9A